MVTEKELELLACLEKSSRLSVDTLAKLLNIEVEEVKKMVKKLEAEKIIVDYVTHIDWTKVKEHTGLTAMIDVKVTPKHGVGFRCSCRTNLSLFRSKVCVFNVRDI